MLFSNLNANASVMDATQDTLSFDQSFNRAKASAGGSAVKVAVIAPFFPEDPTADSTWIDHFIEDDTYDFDHVHPVKNLPKWHDRKSPLTATPEWKIYLRQAIAAFRKRPDVVVSVYPQLAATAGLLKYVSPRTKVIAWTFNVGTCHDGMRRRLAKLALSKVDIVVVHTRREIKIYSDWLDLPESKFVFIPYQSPEIATVAEEETEKPFIAAMGSAHRDYSMFADIIGELNIPTVVASSKAALDGVEIPDCMETPFGITKQDCIRLTQQARINVIPLLPKPAVTAAGQVTLVEAMFMGKVLVATEYYGVEDYIEHEKTGLLVKPHDRDGMRDAILRLWNDADLRQELARNAQEQARAVSSDEAAGQNLRNQLARLS